MGNCECVIKALALEIMVAELHTEHGGDAHRRPVQLMER